MFLKMVTKRFETKYLQGILCGRQQSGNSFGWVGHVQVKLGGVKSNVMNSITTCSFLPQLITLLYLNNSLQYLFDTFFTLMNVYWGKIRFWWHLSFALSPTCAAPTRDGSLVDFSLLKVRHSEPTSTTLDELKEQTQLNCWPTGGDLLIVSLISTPP